MANETEKIKILQMIQNGKITAEQGVELINACCTSEVSQSTLNAASTGGRLPSAQWVRVIVTDMVTGKRRVNVRMPAGLVNTGTKFGARLKVVSSEGTFTVIPKMELGGEGGPIQHDQPLSSSLNISLVGMDAATKAVSTPTTATIVITLGACENNTAFRPSMYTPAVTIVAA